MRALMKSLADAPWSYPEVGATRTEPPPGYDVDHRTVVVGTGDAAFAAAREALRRWAPFRMYWIRSFADGPPEEGRLVAVVARVLGIWWTNVSRVIYTIDEPLRSGFAYGTLRAHAERGEERFLVELDPASGRVTYSVLAFSRPRHPLARLAYPFTRAVQFRFGVGTRIAMRAEVRRLVLHSERAAAEG